MRSGTEASALVVGGGISGIQAALDLADAGVRVVLLEKGDSIGGRMAQTDKTFPTLDCSSCTLTPRTAEAGSHPGIELLTRAELLSAEREGPGLRVQVRLRPRYVDLETCVNCGRCAEACRLKGHVPSAFDLELKRMSAIAIPFPQAVPAAYAINPEKCLFLTRGKCGTGPKCVEACQVGAVRLEEREQVRELSVGAVVVAAGYDLYRPDASAEGRPELGFGRYPGVITNLQFERLSSASGPTGGKIKVGPGEPKRVVFLQCVGSRDRTTGARYCSRVCCMVSVKQAVLALEKIPGAEATILYMDLRAFGKGYEEFLERAQRMGVLLRRGNPSEVYRRGEGLAVRFEDTLLGLTEELPADLVVLAAGLRPRGEFPELAGLLGVPLGEDGFFEPADRRDVALSPAPGVFLAGACSGPMDIPDAVASGSAAAGAAVAHVRRSLELQVLSFEVGSGGSEVVHPSLREARP
ncbi:MAG: CoB--CoM heterodisulfide reductase iron-sulfur subunit A family protein [Deltaproteobacteria bacterium]|nr:CoB--CoM heterodisulfide reductase iron-sulfur subunit A family protein [Deltaproteobacteria bacterium]